MSYVHRRSRNAVLGVAGALCLTLVIAACGGGSSGGIKLNGSTSGGSSSTPASTSGSKDEATFALPAGSTPNWIFPMIDPAHSSIDNRNQFQYLMYRPLYWFGNGSQPTLNPQLSVADPPKYASGDKSVTLTLKKWKWSNGETVTAQDVAFWLNMLKAEKTQWAYYVPGGIPDNLTDWTISNPSTIVLHFKHAYSPTWFTDNELSQITPLPMAWDKTSASAKGHCATSPSDCAAVWKYLYGQAKQISSYGSSPIWGVVDGPWKLTEYQSTGLAKFTRNPKYSGPVSGNVKTFVEQPFTTEAAELNVLRAGQLSVGYLPVTDLAQKSQLQSAGYTLTPWIDAGVNYFPENFNNPTYGPVFKQLYFRQAVQYLINQPQYISQLYQGYASPDYGPVPNAPASPYLDSYVKNNPYKYDPTKAVQLLTSHGWTVHPGSAATCHRPGTGANDCGAGIKSGLALNLSLNYASGTETLQQEMEGMKSTFAKAGIVLNLSQAPFDQVISQSVACKPTQASCKWQLSNWGGGWSYSMDHLPNGDVIFGSGGGDNFGSYNDSKADALIAKTETVPGSLDQAEDYLAKQLPAIYMPKPDYQLTEVTHGLTGVVPQAPTFNLAPENWTFTSGS
jgi:peptide/nickel transport system substrate-binding protein